MREKGAAGVSLEELSRFLFSLWRENASDIELFSERSLAAYPAPQARARGLGRPRLRLSPAPGLLPARKEGLRAGVRGGDAGASRKGTLAERRPEEIAAGKNYFPVSEGVQLFGKARLLKGGDSGFGEALRFYMPTLTRKPLDEATLERMRKSTIVIEIEPESLVLVDGALLRWGMNYKRIWKP